jgi:Ca2+-transporting ATPase
LRKFYASVTVICSDKTGTLTEGKMTASEMWTSDDVSYQLTSTVQRSTDPTVFPWSGTVQVKQKGNMSPVEVGKKVEDVNGAYLATALACGLCNNSSWIFDTAKSQWQTIGDPTEVCYSLQVF